MSTSYVTQPPSTSMSTRPCFCEFCYHRGMDADLEEAITCCRTVRVAAHGATVCNLLSASSEMVKLLVGSDENEFVCHKALLAYLSGFFDAACYGNMEESHTNEIKMPEENKEGIRAFIAWAYSGHIESEINPELLWVLGDRLIAPLFSNEVMHTMFRIYKLPDTGDLSHLLRAEAAQIAQSQTPAKSQLRRFVMDYVTSFGPLRNCRNDELGSSSEFAKDWHTFIREGGDLVPLICSESGFKNKDCDDYAPFYPENHHKYLIPVTSLPVQDFLRQGNGLSASRKRRYSAIVRD